ncbi:MAG TPA: hypothetical protein VFM69_13360 [Pricia sp.]|nr:hypothetical protein [Pricia sp.]
MQNTISFLKGKLREAKKAKSRYDAYAYLECWEQVTVDGLIEEIVNYENAIEIIRTYRGYIKSHTPLKKVAQ